MSKTVIITGCSRGLGLALANKYLEEGFNTVNDMKPHLKDKALEEF